MLSGKGSELALLVAEALVWLFRMLTTLGLILTAGTPRWFVGTLQCHIHCDKTVPFFSVAWLTDVTEGLSFSGQTSDHAQHQATKHHGVLRKLLLNLNSLEQQGLTATCNSCSSIQVPSVKKGIMHCI